MRQQDPNTLQTKEAGSLGQRWPLCSSKSFDPSYSMIHMISTHHPFSDSCLCVSELAKLFFSESTCKGRCVRVSCEAAFEVQEFTRWSRFEFCFRHGKVGLRLWRWQGVKGHKPYRIEMECIVDPAEPVKLEILVFARARNVLRVFCDSFSGRWPSWDEESSRRKGCKSRWNGLHRIARATGIHSDYRGLHSLLPEWLPVSQGAWTTGVCHTITSSY